MIIVINFIFWSGMIMLLYIYGAPHRFRSKMIDDFMAKISFMKLPTGEKSSKSGET